MRIPICLLCLLTMVACQTPPGKPAGEESLVLTLRGGPGGIEPVSGEPRLAPELDYVRRWNGTYLGRTRSGRAVVRVPPAAMDEAAKDQNVDLTSLEAGESFDVIRELVVLLPRPEDAAALKAAGLSIARPLSNGRGVVIRTDAFFTGKELAILLDNRRVRYVEPNYVFRLQAAVVPDDPWYTGQWGLASIRAPHAWARSTGAGSPVVAVTDTGVQLDHPDLASNLWKNGDPVDGVDNDGNGEVDDLHGWSAFLPDNNQPTESKLHHGTHVSGIVGAIGNNTAGVTGVLWNARVMIIKIFEPDPDKPWCALPASADRIAAGIDYAVANGAKVINASWGGAGDPCVLIATAIRNAGTKDVLVVVAAGNDMLDVDASPYFPASIVAPHVIKVINLDQWGLLGGKSNWGSKSTCIAAPGDWIDSTVLGGTWGSLSGTSMAAPHVAAAAALIWSIPKYGALTAPEMRTLLMDNARKLDSLQGLCAAGGTLDLGFLEAGEGPVEPVEPVDPEPVDPDSDDPE